MRLLAIKPPGIALPAIHDSTIRALRSLDASVTEIPVPGAPEEILNFRHVLESGFQAVFAIDAGVLPKFISCLKELQESSRIPYLIWFLDDPEGYRFPAAFHQEYTVGFCWDPDISAKMSSHPGWKGRPISYLPLGADPSVFFPSAHGRNISFPGGAFVGSTAHENRVFDEIVRTTPDFEEDADKIWQSYLPDMRQSLPDLAWHSLAVKTGRDAAGLREDPFAALWVRGLIHRVGIKKRATYVSTLIGRHGCVFGDEGWRDLLDAHIYRGPISYGDPVRKIYHESAFVLDLRQPQARTGLTQRIFDAGACGVPVMAEWSPEIDRLLDTARDIFGFTNLAEARAMKERILRDPEEARRRAVRVQKDILSRHTYLQRAGEILKVLGES